LHVNVETDRDWLEMNNGPLAGISWNIAAEQFPLPIFRNPYEPFCGAGESDWEIYCRVARAIENLVQRSPGEHLVVSHGGILNSTLRTIVGSQPPINHQGIYFEFGDTGYARLVYYPLEHIWCLLEFKTE
jgi:2,3-bisphosphoglycerate-dependent phosphoglycerate mutase